ncbi:hypothetical protein [Actinocorallia populi]|uniref:hypothetical protein n=1 Tax=Actinocorallia populi TaxID=2079200 RepID=UPI000D0937E8|nr:hypothetical protein [Actinocorallia populi]
MAAFTRQLQRAHAAVGPPRPSRLLKISKTLPGDIHLARSTLHDNLSGRRLTLPAWDWVATFIAALRITAKETHLDPDKTVGTIEMWSLRYQATKRSLKDGSCDEQPLTAPIAETASTAATRQAEYKITDSASSGTGTDAEKQSRMATGSSEASSLFADEAAHPYQEWFGDHGEELFRAATHEDAEAACRLGILLLCIGQVETALIWVELAAISEDAMALSLRDADSEQRRELASAYAYELALPVGTLEEDPLAPTGTTSRAPAVYYQAAATAGHAGAAYRLGLLKEAQGEPQEALRWLRIAAHASYPEALPRWERLHHALLNEPEDD